MAKIGPARPQEKKDTEDQGSEEIDTKIENLTLEVAKAAKVNSTPIFIAVVITVILISLPTILDWMKTRETQQWNNVIDTTLTGDAEQVRVAYPQLLEDVEGQIVEVVAIERIARWLWDQNTDADRQQAITLLEESQNRFPDSYLIGSYLQEFRTTHENSLGFVLPEPPPPVDPPPLLEAPQPVGDGPDATSENTANPPEESDALADPAPEPAVEPVPEPVVEPAPEPAVQPVIDLSLLKTAALLVDADGSGDYTPGDTVHFTIEVANAGPNAATGVVVRDVVPNGFSGISNISNGGSLNGATITWSALNVAVNGSLTLSFDAVIEFAGDHTNVAEVVGADQLDSDSTPGNGDATEDDQDSVQITPSEVIDLSLEKTVTGGPVWHPGEVVTFILTVNNAGPNDATGVSVTDPVPAGFSNLTNISNGGTLNGNTIVWSGLSVTAGGNLILTFQATVGAGDLRNVAEVTGADQFDPDSVPGNNDPSEDDIGDVSLALRPPAPVPTLSAWMLSLLGLMLVLLASSRLTRRRPLH